MAFSRYSTLRSMYFWVRAACFSSIFRLLDISKSKSSMRFKSSSVALNLFKVSVLRALYLDTPAACSSIMRREFCLSFSISSTMPKAIIAYEFEPIPVSINSEVMSFKRQEMPFKRYSLSPEAYKIRVIFMLV